MTFTTQRTSLVADTSTAVMPPVAARLVEIGNAGPDDLKVYSASGDEGTYFVIAAGYSKVVDLKQFRFDPNSIAFYLKSLNQAGTAVLIWI